MLFMGENCLSHSGVGGLNVIRRLTRATMPGMFGSPNKQERDRNPSYKPCAFIYCKQRQHRAKITSPPKSLPPFNHGSYI